jgi:hypothetical protein
MCSNRQSLYLQSKCKIYFAFIWNGKHSSIFPSGCSTNNHWPKHHVRSPIRLFMKSLAVLLKSSNPTIQTSNNHLIVSGLTIIHLYASLIYLPTTYTSNNQSTHFSIHPATFPSLYTDASIHSFIHPSIHPSIHPFMQPHSYVNLTSASSHSFILLIIYPSTLNPPIRPPDHPTASSKYLKVGKSTLRDR